MNVYEGKPTGRKIGAYHIREVNPQVYQGILDWLHEFSSGRKDSPITVRAKSQKHRLRRLEVLADKLSKGLKQHDDKSVGFSFDDVRNRVPHEYSVSYNQTLHPNTQSQQQVLRPSTIRSELSRLVRQIELVDQSSGAQIKHRFWIAYEREDGKPKYGYFMPRR